MNKLHIVLVITLLSYALSSSSQKVKTYQISELEIKRYIELNDEENRLMEYKDDKTALLLKINQLAHLNQSRKKHRKKSVRINILACRVANKIAQDAAQNNFMGHFNTIGETPYHRFAFEGGTAHVLENASAIKSTGLLPSSPQDINKYMQDAHNSFMSEQAPNDGHKLNCIDPYHNEVGIGYYLHKGEFRYYEEFLDNYIEFGDFLSSAQLNQRIIIPIKPLEGRHLHMALAYYEEFPKPMTISEINSKMSYDDYTDQLAHKILPWELPEPNANGFTELEFQFKKEGLYYLQIYLDTKPFVSGKATTEKKIQASGIVIKVKK